MKDEEKKSEAEKVNGGNITVYCGWCVWHQDQTPGRVCKTHKRLYTHGLTHKGSAECSVQMSEAVVTLHLQKRLRNVHERLIQSLGGSREGRGCLCVGLCVPGSGVGI